MRPVKKGIAILSGLLRNEIAILKKYINKIGLIIISNIICVFNNIYINYDNIIFTILINKHFTQLFLYIDNLKSFYY